METHDEPEENSMRKRTSVLILSGVLATGAVGAVAITPASATTSANAVTSRLAGIKSALNGLVSDGTLTQSQADKVAKTLNSKLPKHGVRDSGARFGGMGMTQTRGAAAKALGLTTVQLRTALQGGKSLADVAKNQKVSVGALVKAIVTSTESELVTAVKNGTVTQARADKIKSQLTQRIINEVNRARPVRGLRGVQAPTSTGGTPGGTANTSSSAT
jgi:hypothetical protein